MDKNDCTRGMFDNKVKTITVYRKKDGNPRYLIEIKKKDDMEYYTFDKFQIEMLRRGISGRTGIKELSKIFYFKGKDKSENVKELKIKFKIPAHEKKFNNCLLGEQCLDKNNDRSKNLSQHSRLVPGAKPTSVSGAHEIPPPRIIT